MLSYDAAELGRLLAAREVRRAAKENTVVWLGLDGWGELGGELVRIQRIEKVDIVEGWATM